MGRYLTAGVLVVLAAVLLAGCRRSAPAQTVPAADSTIADNISPRAQLMCAAESREEAQALAEQYGIALVDYRNGLATFYTEEDPRDVIRRGKDNGWQELSLNHTGKAF